MTGREDRGGGGTRWVSDKVIRRRRLQARLDRDPLAPLTLVTAPAGFGKTTGIETWLGRRHEQVVWIGVEERDNDAVLLWSRILVEALRSVGLGAQARATLENTLGSPRAAIELFASELEAAEKPVVMVLDDLHLIDDADCLRTLETAARLMAGAASLVLLARREPSLPLERLYGRGQLLWIGPADLSFGREETKDLLRRYEVELEPDALDTVFEVTGGWPAAVYISALWLRETPDASEAARGIARPQEELADYLLSEVIGGLDPETRGFMRRTSILSRISGPLCDHVLQQPGSARLIARLRETNLLVREDRRLRGWHRYHPLLREVLRQEVEDLEPDPVPALQRRAADWFISNDMPEDAAEQARDAGDHELLGDLLAERHLPLMRTGRSATLLRWAEALPADLLDRRPEVTMAAAMAAEIAARPSIEIRRLLTSADGARQREDPTWSAQNEVEWQMLSAGAGEDGVGASVRAAQEAVVAAEDVPQLTHVSRAVCAMYLELAGDLDGAEKMAREVLEEPGVEARPFALLMALGTLALSELNHGRPGLSRGHLEAAAEVISRTGIEDGPIAARIQTCEALLLMEEGDSAAARRSAESALAHSFDTAPSLAWALLVAADTRAAGGDFRGAWDALGRAAELIEASPDAGRIPVLHEEVSARIVSGEAGGTAPAAGEISPAETRVLRLLAEGLTRPEIAEALVISVNTVKTHQRRLYRKLGVGEREEALSRARAHGLVD